MLAAQQANANVVVPHIGANRITIRSRNITRARRIDFRESKVFSSLGSFRKGARLLKSYGTVDIDVKRKVAERDGFVKRMLEKSKEQRRKNRRKNSGTKNEKWREFYSSQWFEEDWWRNHGRASPSGASISDQTRKFRIVPDSTEKEGVSTGFFGAVFSNLIRLRIDDCFVVLYTYFSVYFSAFKNNIFAYYE